MTGYESKKAAALAKTIDEVNWLDHEPNGVTKPAQEPVFWSVTGKDERQAFASLSGAEAYCKGLNTTNPEGNYVVQPLSETPPAPQEKQSCDKRPWVGLTDEEILEIFGRIGTCNADINPYVLLNDARKIEAKLKGKNT